MRAQPGIVKHGPQRLLIQPQDGAALQQRLLVFQGEPTLLRVDAFKQCVSLGQPGAQLGQRLVGVVEPLILPMGVCAGRPQRLQRMRLRIGQPTELEVTVLGSEPQRGPDRPALHAPRL
ncbi:hypothetical protein D9M71_709060 [compost metagenome]